VEEDVELPDPTASAVLRGRVVDDKGEGVAGVQVYTSPKGRAQTDGEGRFEVAGLPPGRVEVRVFHVPGHEVPWPAPFVEAPADDVEIVVVRHARVEGAVVLPVGDMTPPRGHLSYYAESSSGTGGALEDAGPGRFAFTLSCPGSVHHVELYLGDHLPVVWEVEGAPGATIRLPARVLDRGFALQGVVRNPAGRPLPGVRIHVDQDEQREGSWEFGRIERATTTAEDGSFAIPALRPGEALLRAAAPWLFQSRTQTVAVSEAGALLEITLPAEAVVTGRLQNREGLPVAGRSVLLVDPEVEGLEKRVLTSVTTDVGGRFRLRAEAGRYRLEIHEGEPNARRVATSTEVLDLAPNAPRDVILTLGR